MRKKKKHFPNQPIGILETKAADLLAKGRHKEAIEIYKQLLKKQPRSSWQAALAKAYLLRAIALANKGMYKEAVVLWENRANLCTDKACFDQYIHWLIKAGHHINATHLLMESAESLPDDVTWPLWAHIGALLLVKSQNLLDILPADAALLKHYTLIKAALDAYYREEDTTTVEFLKQIPFRSPYRDLRTILNALLIIHSDPNGANVLLKKVHKDSPYAYFAQLIQLAGESEEILLEGLSKLEHHEVSFIAHLKGWDKERMKVISMLQIAAKRDSHKALMEVVIANRLIFGEDYSRQFCMALLPSYPAGIKFYERIFGTLSAYEKNRIIALNYEQKGQSYTAERYWRSCAENLKTRIESDTAQKIAFILRHIVEMIEKRGDTDDDDVPAVLTESLALEPDDKPSYLKLIQWYQHQNDKKNYQKWIDAAIKQFPLDSEVLFLAMEAATSKKAFKKAASLAKKLLKVDPINVKARQMAKFSHLSHARKLIQFGKYINARKELEQATQFERSNQRSGVVQINQGLLELQASGFIKPKKRQAKKRIQPGLLEAQCQNGSNPKSVVPNPKSLELLQEGVQLAGGGIIGQFRVIVESKSQALETTEILPLLFPQNKRTPLPTRHEVLELVNSINTYTKEGITFLKEAVEQVKEPLLRAMKLKFSQEEILSLCQSLKNVAHQPLLKQCADRALKRWPGHPSFFYYQVYGKANANIYQVSMQDIERLKNAAEKAEANGDKRTSTMIIGFLNQFEQSLPPFLNPFDGDDFDDDANELNAIEAILDKNRLSPNELRKFMERLEEMGLDLPDFDVPLPRSSKLDKERKKR
ncbi:MAG: hypothetical protein DRQ49_15330 [Gammaproteobacteria bacterium]|nr:MAG: hypothetical protein DRQ49_15330 [Gammaproteobacteria bacterium]